MNKLIQKQLELAQMTVQALTVAGHLVQGIQLDAFANRPMIWIAHTPRCKELRGQRIVEEESDGQRSYFYHTRIGDCVVRWRQ